MAQLTTLEEILVHDLQNLYDGEQQLIEALPKLAEGATNEDLAKSFKEHLVQTKEHAKRLEQIAKDMEIELDGPQSQGIKGLVEEGSSLLEEGKSPLLDLALIGGARKVEHLEMGGYMGAVALAKELDLDEVVELLKKTLAEEDETDKKLAELAEDESVS